MQTVKQKRRRKTLARMAPVTPEARMAKIKKALDEGSSLYKKTALTGVVEKANTLPTTGLSQREIDARRVTQAEILMLRGVTDPSLIAKRLEINLTTAVLMVKSVHARWEVYGRSNNLFKARGEALNKYDAAERELWTIIQNAKAETEGGKLKNAPLAMSALSMTLQIIERKNALMGLSASAIEHMNDTAEGSNTSLVATRMGKQENLVRIAKDILEFARQQTGPGAAARVINNDVIDVAGVADDDELSE